MRESTKLVSAYLAIFHCHRFGSNQGPIQGIWALIFINASLTRLAWKHSAILACEKSHKKFQKKIISRHKILHIF